MMHNDFNDFRNELLEKAAMHEDNVIYMYSDQLKVVFTKSYLIICR